jgi:hypothetical protein
MNRNTSKNGKNKMEFEVTYTDTASGKPRTDVITGSTAKQVAKNYESLGIKLDSIKEVPRGTGQQRQNDKVVNPLAVKMRPGSSGMPEMDKLRQDIAHGDNPNLDDYKYGSENPVLAERVSSQERRITDGKPPEKYKYFEAAGIKFRMNLLTQQLQEFTWIDSEDDSILDDIGIVLEEDVKMTFREILEHANVESLGFIKKEWQDKNE